MIVRYSSLNRLEKPKFTLCNPGSTVRDGIVSNTVGMLVDTESEEIIFNFNATSELNFRINKIRRESEEDNLYTYRLFNAVQNRRLIFIDDIGYFMITNVDDNFDGGLHYKDVAAKSIDIEIAQKNVPYISDGTYKFTSDGSGDGKGILETIVETLPLWTIGSVDKTVAEKYRTFEGVDTSLNCLSFMLENMQDAFECIFIFDCVNRIINVYSQDNYVRETDIHITKDDLVNSLDITENADDLYTAITVLGNDNVTISAINPIGTNTIYDFSHYYDWMSDGLGSKVRAWQDAVESERDRYYTMNMEYYTKLAEASNLEMEISKYDIQITMYTRCRNNIVASSESDSAMIKEYNDAIEENGGTAITIYPEISETLAGIDSLISECESNKKNVQAELDAVNESITKYKDDIKQVQTRLAIMSYFTESEYTELCHYIYEGSYSDEYVVITDIMTYEEKFKQMKDLYDRAKNRLNQVSRPTQEFNVDVENFIFIKDFEQWSEQLETGCLINVELNTNDIALLFLSNITINYDDKKLTMTFGNRFNKFDAKSLFNNVLGKINKSANTLSYIKDILYPIKNGEFNAMREAIQTSRDLTMGQALASKNEEVVIDGSGYTGRRLLDSGLYDPRQIKITGKNIVLTDDAWESCKVAIGELLLGDNETIYGVNASAIIGDIIMGNSLRIVDKNGKDILTVVDDKVSTSVSSVDEKVENVKNQSLTQSVVEYYLSTSTTELSGGSWSETAPEWVDGKYMWSRTKTTKGDGSVSYSTPTCIAGATGATGPQGVPGLQGPKGDRGIQGPKGADGKTSYTHIAYANSADGATDFTVSDSNRAYIGMYVDFSETDSTNPGDYAWSKIKGADGANGTPGKAGADGKTPYFHVAYANNAAGTSGFSTTDSTNKLYIGQYTDYTQADSTDPKKYAWTKIKGDKGDTGEAGVGVKSIDVQYYLSTSSTTLTGGSWSTTAPAWVNGKYMWSKTVTTLSNGGVEESKPVCITGAKGSTGTSGTTITSITEQYYLSTSKTQQTGGSWVEKPPAWSAGKYLWTRSKIVYANPTKTEYTTPVCDSSWEAVNEVQVGGTNLLLDTDAPSLTKVAAESNRVFTSMVNSGDATGAIEPLYDSPCGTKNVVRIGIVNPGAGGVAGYRFYSATKENTVGVSFIPGEQYTISCYARAVSGEPQINLVIWGLTAWGWKVAPSDWTKFSLTFEATEEFNTKTSAWLLFRVKEDIAGTVEFTGFKLEKGNKATEWSPSPDEARYAIANIQVGARNLQLGTQFWDDNCIRLPGNAEINGEEITIPSNTYTELEKIQVKNGDVYTIGCDVKSDVAYVGNSFLVQLSNEAGTGLSYEWATGSIGTDWSRIVKTITISETESPLFLGIGLRANSGVEGVDCTLTYRHMMVERGTKATDWTPAPEDTQTQIDDQKVILNAQVSRISSLEQKSDSIVASVSTLDTTTKTTFKDITDTISELEKKTELAITEEGVTIAIERKLENADGIFITGTDYGFSAEGLRIAKDGQAMESLLDNSGLEVTRSGEAILTADDTGVNALNLTARQYLIVGDHARFENYETGRTACFWI